MRIADYDNAAVILKRFSRDSIKFRAERAIRKGTKIVKINGTTMLFERFKSEFKKAQFILSKRV